MSLATMQLGIYTKFASKQKATTLAIYLACTKCYSGQLALSSIAIGMGCGVLMLQVMTLMSYNGIFGPPLFLDPRSNIFCNIWTHFEIFYPPV